MYCPWIGTLQWPWGASAGLLAAPEMPTTRQRDYRDDNRNLQRRLDVQEERLKELSAIGDAKQGELEAQKEEIKELLATGRSKQKRLDAQDESLRELSYQYRALKRQSENAQKQHVADEEKIQQQEELLRQARAEASMQEDEHRRQLNQLYAKLNSVQAGRKPLTDEQVKDHFRRLVQNLEAWINHNFRNTEKLEMAIQGDGAPSTSPQRRAWLQAHIASLVFHHIFTPYLFGLQDDKGGHFLREIGAGVKRTSSESSWQTWKIATSVAVSDMARESQESHFAAFIDYVEKQFGSASSTEPEARRRQLLKFLEKCATFKNALTQEPEAFSVFLSWTGAEFSADSMTRVGGDGEAGAKVRLCLWPGISKRVGDDDEVVVEPALVWTVD
ncbi:uncharacterized protein DSM5745_03966 [Aspergillus mulundensis]|uniref:Uncharacterized protein n=1 Tax=Aspergillus mulundensis TaxID=1810919 RepID=A0A3D8SBF3_9EURO|nr:hypothetical protein DSM5745_03966 [Aspergillus mulundensis]RDW83640.1 hypothetical protein DSM5745_03966 [Aspergillus mulundensis]